MRKINRNSFFEEDTQQKNNKRKRDILEEAKLLPKITSSFLAQVIPGVEVSEDVDADDDRNDTDFENEDANSLESVKILYTPEQVQAKLDFLIKEGHGNISKNVAEQKKHKDIDKFGRFLLFTALHMYTLICFTINIHICIFVLMFLYL